MEQILVEEIVLSKLVNKLPALYATRCFTIASARGLHVFLPSASSIREDKAKLIRQSCACARRDGIWMSGSVAPSFLTPVLYPRVSSTLYELTGGGGAGWAPEPLDKVEEEHNVFSLLAQLVAYSLYPVRYAGHDRWTYCEQWRLLV